MRRKTYLLWKKRLSQGVVATVLFGALFVYFRTGFFTITTYKVLGAPEEYKAELEHGIKLLAEDTLYKVLPGNRSISYHDDDIRTLIKETLPNSKDISIRSTDLHTLTVKITPYQPLFSVSDTHAISSDGTIYKEIVPIESLPRITLATTSAVTPATLNALFKLVSNVDAVLFPVRHISLDEYNDIRLYDASKGTSIIVSSRADVSKVWSNILSAIDTDPLKGKLASKAERLEYIDTRFGNKVFYKFTNRSAGAIIPPHVEDAATTTSQ